MAKKPKLMAVAQTLKSQRKSTPKPALQPSQETKKSQHTVSPSPRLRPTYDTERTILLLGEGDFSFTKALLDHHLDPNTSHVIATTLDSEEITVEKYPNAQDTLTYLRDHDIDVLFNIDATRLASYKKLHKFTFGRVIFNFPHSGAGIKDQDRNIRHHQLLLASLFQSIHQLISLKSIDNTNRPQLHITLKQGEPYASWNIKGLAKRHGWSTLFSAVFDPKAYPGYEHRRTLGWKEGVSVGDNAEIIQGKGSRVYIFTPVLDTVSTQNPKPKKRKHTSIHGSDDEDEV